MAARTATTVGSEHGAGPARWRGMTRPVAAQEQGAGEARPRWAVEPVETTVVAAGATQKLREELLAGPDVPAVLGAGQLAEVQAAEHRLADGRTLWALAGQLSDDEVVVAYRDDAGRVEALRYRVIGEVAELRAVRAGGVVQYPAGAAGGSFGPASCPPGWWPCQRCCGVDLREIENGCGGCVISCTPCAWFRTIQACAACLACLLVWCPFKVFRACRFCWTCCPESPPWGP